MQRLHIFALLLSFALPTGAGAEEIIIRPDLPIYKRCQFLLTRQSVPRQPYSVEVRGVPGALRTRALLKYTGKKSPTAGRSGHVYTLSTVNIRHLLQNTAEGGLLKAFYGVPPVSAQDPLQEVVQKIKATWSAEDLALMALASEIVRGVRAGKVLLVDYGLIEGYSSSLQHQEFYLVIPDHSKRGLMLSVNISSPYHDFLANFRLGNDQPIMILPATVTFKSAPSPK